MQEAEKPSFWGWGVSFKIGGIENLTQDLNSVYEKKICMGGLLGRKWLNCFYFQKNILKG